MMVFLVQLSESDKRKIAIIAIILATIIVLIGIIGDAIKRKGEKEGKFIDSYMYYMCKYGFIKNGDQFKTYVQKRETRTLYFDTRWSFRWIFLLTALFLLYFYNFNNFDFTNAIKALDSLRIQLSWPTEHFFGLTLVSDWPTLIKAPDPLLTIDGYVTYTFGLISLMMLIFIINHIYIYNARIKRAKSLINTVFSPNLENTTFVR
jgi:hypothetical protein